MPCRRVEVNMKKLVHNAQELPRALIASWILPAACSSSAAANEADIRRRVRARGARTVRRDIGESDVACVRVDSAGRAGEGANASTAATAAAVRHTIRRICMLRVQK